MTDLVSIEELKKFDGEKIIVTTKDHHNHRVFTHFGILEAITPDEIKISLLRTTGFRIFMISDIIGIRSM